MDIKDLEKVIAIMKAMEGDEPNSVEKQHIGDKVIVRCRDAGVHFGTLVDYQGREVRLKNSRRMWYWKAASGHTLSGCAVHGIKDSKIAAELESIVLMDACEIIPCSTKAANSIGGADEYQP